MHSDEYRKRVVEPEWKKLQSARKTPAPLRFGPNGEFSEEDIEQMTAQEFKQKLKLKTAPKRFSTERAL